MLSEKCFCRTVRRRQEIKASVFWPIKDKDNSELQSLETIFLKNTVGSKSIPLGQMTKTGESEFITVSQEGLFVTTIIYQ